MTKSILTAFGICIFVLADLANAKIVERFDENGLVVSRRDVVEDRVGAGFELDYEFDETAGRHISTGFRVFDENGKVTRARSAQDPLPCGLPLPAKKERAIVVDIVPADIRNPVFKDKIFVNADEILNGLDDDNNGLIDDCSGYSVQDWKGNAPLVAPMIDKKGKLIELNSQSLNPDVDHATMSMAIAARGLNDVAFIAVGGHLQKKAFYDAVAKTVADEKVRFVNISLGVPGLDSSSDGESFSDPAAYMGMKSLIEKSPGTLFVVAAGNGGFLKGLGLNIDRIGLYPAAFWMPNILSVAASASNVVTARNLPEMKIADFSNVGITNVDVVAPGTNMIGMLSGGSVVGVSSGTSFASPYTMNLAMKLAVKYPELNIFQLKELIMRTVYIPDLDLALQSGELGTRIPISLEMNPRFFPVRSGGVVYPTRAFKAAQILSENPALSIEEASLKARALTLVKDEAMNESKVRELWRFRKIEPAAR